MSNDATSTATSTCGVGARVTVVSLPTNTTAIHSQVTTLSLSSNAVPTTTLPVVNLTAAVRPATASPSLVLLRPKAVAGVGTSVNLAQTPSFPVSTLGQGSVKITSIQSGPRFVSRSQMAQIVATKLVPTTLSTHPRSTTPLTSNSPSVMETIKDHAGSPVSKSPSTSNAQRTVIREMQVRVPNRQDKRFSVLRFHSSDRIDLSTCPEVFMQRENNLRHYRSVYNIGETPEQGAGSVYGREAKEEARLKKFGVVRQAYRPDDQPWLLTAGKGKASRRFKGVREGSISENVQYFVFCQYKDGTFDAYPVHAWYKMKPQINYRFLREEEAEAEYSRMNKTYNLFNVMVKRKLTDTDGDDEPRSEDKDLKYLMGSASSRSGGVASSSTNQSGLGGAIKPSTQARSRKNASSFRLTDMDEWSALDVVEDEDDVDEDENEGEEHREDNLSKTNDENVRGKTVEGGDSKRSKSSKQKQKAAAIVARMRRKPRRRRKPNTGDMGSSSDEDLMDEARDDSEVDDHEGDELDYMTNSSSDEEKLSEDEREKIYEVTGVDDEAGLKGLLTDLSDEDEEEEQDGGKTWDESVDEGEAEKRRGELPSGSRGNILAGSSAAKTADTIGEELSKSRNRKKRGTKEKKEADNSSSSSSSSSEGDSSSYSSSSDSEVDPDAMDNIAQKDAKKVELLNKLSESIHGVPTSSGSKVVDDMNKPDVGKRLPVVDEDTFPSSASKKLKLESTQSSGGTVVEDDLTATVRKYLMRKPITVHELLKKIRLKKLVNKNEDTRTTLANVLRKLRPIKQVINGQHVLSLKR